MRIEHIIWEGAGHAGKETGILEIEVFYHGGGEQRLIVSGTFDHDKANTGTPNEAVTTPAAKLDFGAGVAGVHLLRVGTLVGD